METSEVPTATPNAPLPPDAAASPSVSTKRRRILVGILAALVIIILVGAALGYVFYRRIFATSPAELLPADTLAYISVANYQEDDEQNPWLGLQQLLRYFPLLKDLEIADSANAYRRAISQTLGGTIELDKIPNLGPELTVGVTYLPESAKKLSLLFTPDQGSQVAGINSEAEAAAPAAPSKDITPADLPGVLVFVSLENPGELLTMLRDISDESKVTIEPVKGRRIYKIKPKEELETMRRRYTQVREVYSTLAGQYLVLGLRLEDVEGVTNVSSWLGSPKGGRSFADVEAYKKVAEEAANERPLVWYVTQDPFNNPARLFSFFTGTSQREMEGTEEEKYLAGRLAIEEEGIRLHSWYPTLASTEELEPTDQSQNLISKLPEKILGQWVSLYMEQRDVDGILGWSMDADDEDLQSMLQEAGEELLGLNIQTEVLPVLSGRTAFMLAPRYDGNAPHIALIVESEQSEAILNEKANKMFSAIQKSWNEELARKARSNRERLESYQAQSYFTDRPLPPYYQNLQTEVVTVERVEEPLGDSKIVTLLIPESGGTYGFQQVSYAVSGKRLIIATDFLVVRELAGSLQGQGNQLSLLKNTSVAEQLKRHPDTTTHLTYLYPQGIVGILKWGLCGAGGMCRIGDPETEAIAELINSHLLVTRTMGTSFTGADQGALETVFLQMVPLTADQQQKFRAVLGQVGVEEDDINEAVGGLGGEMEELLGNVFQEYFDPEGDYQPSSSSSAKANDDRIKSDIGQLRTLAEVYYDANNNSYAGLDRCFEAPSVINCKDNSTVTAVGAVVEDLELALGSGSDLTVNASRNEFCLSHGLRAGTAVCVDSTGRFSEGMQAICGARATQCPEQGGLKPASPLN